MSKQCRVLSNMGRYRDGPIDEAIIRQWGYDEELFLAEQDEDLLLGDISHFQVLAELAKDPNCPKADYALAIMDFWLMFQVLRNCPLAAEHIRAAIELFSDTHQPLIKRFIDSNRLRLELLSGLGEVSHERALTVGVAALNGVSRKAEILVKDGGHNWIVELSVPPFHLHRERLTLDKQTGQFSFEYPLQQI